MSEDKIMATIFFGPVLLVFAPIWLPVLLAVKLFRITTKWALED